MELGNLSVWILLIITITTRSSSEPCPMVECSCIPVTFNPQMRMIMCKHQNIRYIPKSNFTREIFHEISFNGCSIRNIGTDAFRNVKTRQLDFSSNNLESISDNAFNGLEKYLTVLILEGENYLSLSLQAMKKLTRLVELNLKNFKLDYLIEDTLLDYWPDLEYLALVNMHIQFVSSHAFHGKLSKLKELDFISNTAVSTFPVTSINHLQNLEKLKWNRNEMKIIPSFAFRNLSKLTFLDLSCNQIRTLESNCFQGITQTLETLSLSLNLFLSENNLCSVLSTFWPKLKVLKLAYNELQTIPEECFQGMPALTDLNLAGNRLHTIHSNFFSGLVSIVDIDLSENRIGKTDPGVFENTKKLQTLHLTTQKGTDLNSKICLNVSTFDGVERSLTSLYLGGNDLQKNCVWSVIRVLTNLQIIDLGKTGLSTIEDGVFTQHKHMRQLILSDNGLSNISRNHLRGLEQSLTNLDLRKNFLQSIDECVLKDFKRLEVLFLASNPLLCDCRLVWLHDWINGRKTGNQTKTDIMPGYVVQAVCDSPKQLKGKQVYELNKGEFTCMTSKNLSNCDNRKNISVPESGTGNANFKDTSYGLIIVVLVTVISGLVFYITYIIRNRQHESKARKHSLRRHLI